MLTEEEISNLSSLLLSEDKDNQRLAITLISSNPSTFLAQMGLEILWFAFGGIRNYGYSLDDQANLIKEIRAMLLPHLDAKENYALNNIVAWGGYCSLPFKVQEFPRFFSAFIQNNRFDIWDLLLFDFLQGNKFYLMYLLENAPKNIQEKVIQQITKNGNKIELTEWDFKYSYDPDAIHRIPPILFEQKHLKHLHIKFRYAQKLEHNLEKLHQLTNLESLELVNLSIKKVPSSIKKLSKLRSINLSGNKIEKLPEAIGQLSKLRHLFINNCPNLESLPQSIKNLKNLQTLKWSNVVQSFKVKEFPLQILSLPFLERLDLLRQRFKEIPQRLSTFKHLRSLHLTIDQKGQFPFGAAYIDSLEILHIDGRMGKPHKIQLPKLKGRLPNLTILGLDHITFSHYPYSLKELKNLEYLKSRKLQVWLSDQEAPEALTFVHFNDYWENCKSVPIHSSLY